MLKTRIARNWVWLGGVALLLAGTAFEVFWQLQHAERSGYYAMVATSMSRSWHNAFFGAADPTGMLALDKIPGSYLIPALLVHLIGFHNAAVVAPNGIATMLAVLAVASAGRRLGTQFLGTKEGGIWSGLLAGGLMATTPIIIAVARSNEPESAFLLSMSLVAYFSVRALEGRRLTSLVLAGLAIALAFQQYMIMAWTVWPALALGYWFGGSEGRLVRLRNLAIAGGASLLASLTWIFAVWLTPANRRPYIGNTLHNNPWEMVFGYNAIGRFGNSGHMAGQRAAGAISFKTFTPPFSGHPSLIRMFYHQVIGQISWLIPATVLVLVFLWLQNRSRGTKQHRDTSAYKRQAAKQGQLVFLGVWFLSGWAMFSAVSGMHQYYAATLALSMTLLVAVGVVSAFGQGKWGFLISLAFTSVGFAILVSALNPSYHRWLAWLQLSLAFGFAAMALLAVNRGLMTRGASRVIGAALLVGAIGFSPAAWSADAMNHPSFVNPMAGPPDSYTTTLGHHSGTNTELNGGSGRKNSASITGRASRAKISHGKVLDWLLTRPHGKYLLTAFGSDAAAPYLVLQKTIVKKLNVLPVGGFNGTDPVPTLAAFKDLVAKHQINYVLMNHYMGDESAFSGLESAKIKRWVAANCHKNHTPPDRVTLFYCWAQ